MPANSCWIGLTGDCSDTHLGWVSRARNNTSYTCTSDYCEPSYDDSQWRLLDLPHDWSREDLPPRDDDPAAPVLALRNGTWLFKTGDDPSWSQPNLPDRDWMQVSVPHDWRDPPISYTQSNATAWYRRHFNTSSQQLQAATQGILRLALGSVSSADTTYLNGIQIGSTGSSSQAQCADFLNYRSYAVSWKDLRRDRSY